MRRLRPSLLAPSLLALASLVGCADLETGPGDTSTGDDSLTEATPACTPLEKRSREPSARLAKPLREATADGLVTSDEWNRLLAPVVAKLPKQASKDSRALVALWTGEGGARLDDAAQSALQQVLESQLGYTIRYYHRPSDKPLAAWLAANITEVDVDFECLSSIVGGTNRANTLAKVAVLDSGFDVATAPLASKIWTNEAETAGNARDDDGNGLPDDVHGWDFYENKPLTKDDADPSHGTHVMGLLTAGTTRLPAIALRVSLPLIGSSEPIGQHMHDAITYAAAHGARFVNRSGPVRPQDVAAVTDAMRAHPDVLFAIAAGNDGMELTPESHPIGALHLPNVIVVGAADDDGAPADYASFSRSLVDVAVFGGSVSTSGDTKDHFFYPGIGTSMATPSVLNVAAKAQLLAPSLTPTRLKQLLILASQKSDAWKTKNLAGGVVDSGAALRIAALLGLADANVSLESAADQIGLEGDTRTSLIAAAQQLKDGS